MRVVRPGQADATHRLEPPTTVEEALQAMCLTGRMEDSAQVSMAREEVMQAGEYNLFLAQPQGEVG